MSDDAQAWVFSEGLAIYQDITPVSETGARKALGKLGKQWGWKALRDALRAVKLERPREPYGYMMAILKQLPPDTGLSPAAPPRLDGRAPPSDTERMEMLKRFAELKDTLRGRTPETLGEASGVQAEEFHTPKSTTVG